jgi:hypothetical protein
MNWGAKRWALLLTCVVVLTFIAILGQSDTSKASAKTFMGI